MPYVEGFVVVVPKKKIAAYTKLATLASRVWKEHGAVEYCECLGDDLDVKFGLPFPKLAKTKPSETVVFAWIVYKSKAHRKSVGAKVMADPRLASMCDPKNLPFDLKRMACGGFKVLVSA